MIGKTHHISIENIAFEYKNNTLTIFNFPRHIQSKKSFILQQVCASISYYGPLNNN